MVGTLAVSKNPKGALDRLNKARPQVRAQWPLLVTNKPLLQQAFVQNSPARSICVGLPGGVNYLFDAETCAVVTGPARFSMERTARAVADGTTRLANARSARRARCRWAMASRSLKAIAGWEHQIVLPCGQCPREPVDRHAGLAGGILKRGLQYTFKVTGAKGTVTFKLNPEQVLAEAGAGKWNVDKPR